MIKSVQRFFSISQHIFDITLFMFVLYHWITSIIIYLWIPVVIILEYYYLGTYLNVLFYFIICTFMHFDYRSPVYDVLRSIYAPLIASYRRSLGSYEFIKDPDGIDFNQKIIDSKRNTIVMSAPHGFFTFGTSTSSEIYENCFIAMAPVLCRNPVMTFFVKLIGFWKGVIPINNKSITKFLERGTGSLSVVTGGYTDMLYSSSDKYMLYTGKWKYYIRRALMYDYNIAFKWVFGENDMFTLFPTPRMCKRFPLINKIKYYGATKGMITTLFNGRYGLLPYPNPVTFRITGYFIDTHDTVANLNRYEKGSEEYIKLLDQYVEHIYEELKTSICFRIEYALLSDAIYGNKDSKYVLVEDNKDIIKHFM